MKNGEKKMPRTDKKDCEKSTKSTENSTKNSKKSTKDCENSTKSTKKTYVARITASENYQTITVEVEFNKYSDLVSHLKSLRNVIYEATKDINEKKEKVEEPKQEVRMATAGQLKYLNNLGYEGDTNKLTFEEASKLIDKLGGCKLNRGN